MNVTTRKRLTPEVELRGGDVYARDSRLYIVHRVQEGFQFVNLTDGHRYFPHPKGSTDFIDALKEHGFVKCRQVQDAIFEV